MGLRAQVHNDLKTKNILLSKGYETAKIGAPAASPRAQLHGHRRLYERVCTEGQSALRTRLGCA